MLWSGLVSRVGAWHRVNLNAPFHIRLNCLRNTTINYYKLCTSGSCFFDRQRWSKKLQYENIKNYVNKKFIDLRFDAFIYCFIHFQRAFVSTSRQLRRIESVSRSPICNHFFETINGTSTIRAYSQQEKFVLESYRRVDESQVAHYPAICANR